MAESSNGNGEQYIKYTTKELLREIALKVDRIEENSAPRHEVERRFDRVEQKLDKAISSTEDDIRGILTRLTIVETARAAETPQMKSLARTVREHDKLFGEMQGQSKFKRWGIPILLSVLSIIIAIAGIWVALKTGSPTPTFP